MTTRLPSTVFDAACRRCPRLVRHLGRVKAANPGYHCAPVAPFGDRRASLLVVGLAPGEHGANASGRPFTGDAAGIILYETLHRHGFASRPASRHRRDGLRLQDCRITNAVKCLPPENRPTGAELRACNPYLAAELALLPAGGVVVALGSLAHGAVLRAMALTLSRHPFAHGAAHALPGDRTLLDSYHCSQRNTRTGRLTAAMFDRVFRDARARLAARGGAP